MTVRVLFFSSLRDLAGESETEVQLSEGARVADLLSQLEDRISGLSDWANRLLVAVDHEYAGRDQILTQGQEVAVMPPVQGG